MTTATATPETDNDSLRQKALETSKRHKASWIELGQFLHAIHRDKLYKHWGYLAFETYCRKELGIKEATAAKLLKSYFFLEKEEPRLASPESFVQEDGPRTVPNYESVNLLRLAKENKKLTTEDFAEVRESVLDQGREPKEVRAQVKKLISEREPKDPAEERRSRRNAAIRRLVTMLSRTRRELQSEGLIPEYLVKQIGELSAKLEDQIEE